MMRRRLVGRVIAGRVEGGKAMLVFPARKMLGMIGHTARNPKKAAIGLVSKCLACDWGAHRIVVNAIPPPCSRPP